MNNARVAAEIKLHEELCHSWRDTAGRAHATVDLDGVTLFFDDAELARAVAAQCLWAAGEIERLALCPAADRGDG